MSNIPAFPSEWRNDGDFNAMSPDGQVVPPGGTIYLPGMSLRDYFAAKALTGMIAAEDFRFSDIETAAVRSYRIADAMLKARK